MPRPAPVLTETEFALLLSGRISSINVGAARLTHTRFGDSYYGLFIMTGALGAKHTLDAKHTDFERLLAHWKSFSANTANAVLTDVDFDEESEANADASYAVDMEA
jgi:hypothetical protein